MFKIQKLDFLISLYIASVAISELMGAKTIPLFTFFGIKLSTSVAIIVVLLIYSINDIITEVYGKERAQSIVRSGLLMVLFFFLFSILATNLPPSLFFQTSNKAYDTVFAFSARISLASLIAFACGEFADIFIFRRIRERLGKQKLWLRTNVANFISQFIDTTLFLTLAFYAFNMSFTSNISFLVGLILPYWLLKCCVSVIETPFVYLGVKWLRDKKLK